MKHHSQKNEVIYQKLNRKKSKTEKAFPVHLMPDHMLSWKVTFNLAVVIFYGINVNTFKITNGGVFYTNLHACESLFLSGYVIWNSFNADNNRFHTENIGHSLTEKLPSVRIYQIFFFKKQIFRNINFASSLLLLLVVCNVNILIISSFSPLSTFVVSVRRFQVIFFFLLFGKASVVRNSLKKRRCTKRSVV